MKRLVVSRDGQQRAAFVGCMAFDASADVIHEEEDVWEMADNVYCTVTEESAQGAMVQYGPFDRVIYLFDPEGELEPTHYNVDNVEDFEAAYGERLAPNMRVKMENRVFGRIRLSDAMIGFQMIHIMGNHMVLQALQDDPPEPQPLPDAWRKRLREPEEGEGCAVCMSAAATIALVPCGHQCLCDTCAADLMERKTQCPICRGAVESIIRPVVSQ